MTKRREKGKIPHSEWPKIRRRHAEGESLASIARHYGCTGPAIRYIINHLRDADATADIAPAETLPERSDEAATLPAIGGDAHDMVSAGHVHPQPVNRGPDKVVIDADLRWRVSSEIASFLTVFDSFLTENSSDNYNDLLGATDRLMRVAARIRIELERSGSLQSPALPSRPARRARTRVA